MKLAEIFELIEEDYAIVEKIKDTDSWKLVAH